MKIQNELALFERPMTGHLFPYQIALGAMSVLGMIVGFIMTLPPVTVGGPYVLIGSILLMIITIVGHHTHIARKFDEIHMNTWNEYKKLPKSIKRSVRLDTETLLEMDFHTANALRNKFNDLRTTHNNRLLEESKANGKQREIFNAVDEVLKHEEHEYNMAREVNAYMNRKELV